MMSSLSDLQSTRVDTSSTRPVTSMAMTFTGMATVLPVKMAVLMISVSCGRRGEERGFCLCPFISRDMSTKALILAAATPQRHILPLGTLAPVCRDMLPPRLMLLL